MRKELADRLRISHQKILLPVDSPTAESGSGVAVTQIQVGDGWYTVIDTLCSQLQLETDRANAPQVTTTRIREVAGQLRFLFDISRASERQIAMIDVAESLTARICSVCGAPAGELSVLERSPRCEKHDPMIRAADHDESSLRSWVRKLFHRPASPDDVELSSRLNQAIRDGNPSAVKSAIAAGAKLHLCSFDRDGFHTPIELARRLGDPGIIEAIRDTMIDQTSRTTDAEDETMRSESVSRALAFHGELEEEDGSFTCIVERLVIDAGRVAIQMACIDEGGPHTAEGSFELENSRWRTRDFSVKYKADGSRQSATFRLISAVLSHDSKNLSLIAEWEQAGDRYSLEGTLDRLQVQAP